eukprot:CAMPEP_0184484988 /NCGR_PEP_ID=MMETSP0113_2-20130426/6638_1 /TAXON_ID=91329 /ORGANISM="Norrisiella sphaerica, Strain BC52" /LENGTH=334 /DNA_ID=CAMNT_0026866229 /DNA_START=663 /DNA_END=1667 /DNA_ORIENTATION=-
MGEATTYSSNFDTEDNPTDGILGLGFQGASKMNGDNVVANMKKQGLIENSTFSFILGGDPSADGEDGSFLLIGPPDWNYVHDNKITYVDVNPGGMWGVTLNSVLIDGKDYGYCGDSGCSALPDTGTSMIVVPLAYWEHFSSKITKGRNDCKKINSGIFCTEGTEGLPTFSLVFGRSVFHLEPKQYMLSGEVLGFMPSNFESWILGDTFLKNVYTVFNMDNRTVGFAHTRSTGVWHEPYPILNALRTIFFYLAMLLVTASVILALWGPLKRCCMPGARSMSETLGLSDAASPRGIAERRGGYSQVSRESIPEDGNRLGMSGGGHRLGSRDENNNL